MQKVMTFTGGLGAQIFSASGYYYLQSLGEQVSAHTAYFDIQPHLAEPGRVGDMSHWSWELDSYGISRNSFLKYNVHSGGEIIWDGAEKIKYGFLGLQDINIRKKFPILDSARTTISEMFDGQSYACVHVRRGDYLNVASHVIQDAVYFKAIKRLCKIVKNVLIISDSEIAASLINMLRTLNCNVVTAVGGSPLLAHGLMRLSDVLVCSNSQLSYTAGALRDLDELTFYPSQHDGDLNSYTNKYLQSIQEFQLLTKY